MLYKILFVTLLLSFAVRAAEIGAPTPAGARPAEGTQLAPPSSTTGLESVCSDLVQAVCLQNGKPVDDGTGSTRESSTLADVTFKNATEYYRGTVSKDSKFQTALNKLLSDASARADLRTMTGVDCDLQSIECLGKVRAKTVEILEGEFIKDTRSSADRFWISDYCFEDDCRYDDHQSEAFFRLLMADKLTGLLETVGSYKGKFFETQNVGMRKRVTALYPKIREEMKRVVAGMDLPEEVKTAIAQKLDATNISTDCVGEGYDPRSFAWSSMAKDGSRQITVCDGLLTGNSSDFSVVFSLAHELAHQFDPCLIHFGPEKFHYRLDPAAKVHADYEKQNPFYDGVKCLRDPEKSIGAVTTENYTDESFFHDLDLSVEFDQRKTPFCYADRMPEAFADAIGAKVMASYFQNGKNTEDRKFTSNEWRAGLINTATLFSKPSAACGNSGLYRQSPTDEYPSTNNRLNGLLMANKEIRGLAGCKEPSHYLQCF